MLGALMSVDWITDQGRGLTMPLLSWLSSEQAAAWHWTKPRVTVVQAA